MSEHINKKAISGIALGVTIVVVAALVCGFFAKLWYDNDALNKRCESLEAKVASIDSIQKSHIGFSYTLSAVTYNQIKHPDAKWLNDTVEQVHHQFSDLNDQVNKK